MKCRQRKPEKQGERNCKNSNHKSEIKQEKGSELVVVVVSWMARHDSHKNQIKPIAIGKKKEKEND